MTYDDRLGNYNDVASRMREFFEKHPDGCLRPAEPWRVEMVEGKAFIVYSAAAHRTPDDPNPGIGCAWEPFPGRTPYTKDSELMNAETSAWGRAILAVGAADTKRGIASQEEVRNRHAEDEHWDAATPASAGHTQRFDEFGARLASAETVDDIKTGIGPEIHGARSAGDISPNQYVRLQRAAAARMAELAASEPLSQADFDQQQQRQPPKETS